MLEKEFKYFQDHRNELAREHEGKFVVIKDESVIAFYDSELQAYTETKKSHEPGTFLIQKCLPGENPDVQIFHRVYLPGPVLSSL
jgi:hypothetical protein